MACWAQGYTISTIAGSNLIHASGDGGPAISAGLSLPVSMALDSAGNLYIADLDDQEIRKVSTSGIITTVAGGGQGTLGDGGSATAARLSNPSGVAVDASGNIYIADTGNRRVRKVANGMITTIAGGGTLTLDAAEGVAATSVALQGPSAVAVDSQGNVYVADGAGAAGGAQIKKITNGNIMTIAGADPYHTNPLSNGDGGPATSATIYSVVAMALEASGNIYFADPIENRVREVFKGGAITTIAGNNTGKYSGDGGPATLAGLNAPEGVAVDSAGNVYISDTGDQLIRVVAGGKITTIAGDGVRGFSGDGSAATAATFSNPAGLLLGSGGVIYVADAGNNRIRALTPAASGAPSIKSGGIVSAGAFGALPAAAPGSWIEIYGSNLASDSRPWAGADFNGVNAPTMLDGTSVTIGGVPAYVDYISSGQVNAQVPSNVATGQQQVIVQTPSGPTAPYTITVNPVEAALLAPSTFNIGGKQYAAALFNDGGTYVLPPGAVNSVTSRRAQPGNTITLYGIGFGPVTPMVPAGVITEQQNALTLPFHVFFGQTEAMASYAGLAPGSVGLYQFNVVVPNVASSDAVPLTFTLNGVPGTQTLYTAVQNGAAAPAVLTVTLSAASVAGGSPVQGTVTLSGPAPAGNAVVSLISSSSAVSVPSTVTVAAGATSAIFTVMTTSIAVNLTATITATYGGAAAQASVTVTAASSVVQTGALTCACIFQPVNYPAMELALSVYPNAGNLTFTATANGITFINGTASSANLTFTFDTFQTLNGFPPFFFASGILIEAHSASLELTLQPASGSSTTGTLTGTLTVTGPPYPAGGTAVTFSGPVSGSYVE